MFRTAIGIGKFHNQYEQHKLFLAAKVLNKIYSSIMPTYMLSTVMYAPENTFGELLSKLLKLQFFM